VAWAEYNHDIGGDDWDVVGQRIRWDGKPVGRAALGPTSAATHKLQPKVAGCDGRYLVAFTERQNTGIKTVGSLGDRITVRRFDWSGVSSIPVFQSAKTVDSIPVELLTTGYTNRPIAYDINTRSHWAVAWTAGGSHVQAARIGRTGGTVEEVQLYQSASGGNDDAAAICYNDDGYEFQIVWAADESTPKNKPVYGARLGYFSTARAVAYGRGCKGSIQAKNSGPLNHPFAGSEFFTLDLKLGLPATPTTLFASIGAGSLPLPFSSGCYLYLDNLVLIDAASALTDTRGNLSVPMPLPDTTFQFDVYWQFVQLDPRAGRLASTNGMKTQIR
jgi:hypothetical protein